MAAVAPLQDQDPAPTPPTLPGPEQPGGFGKTLKTFPRSFWMGCGIEMWERLAYYGTRQVVGLYIAQASDPMGLHFTQEQKGSIFFWWALVQSLVPMVSGGFSDRYGYKKTIVCSTLLTAFGYVLMGTQRSYAGFTAGCLVLAFGTAIFKPGIQGTLAQSMTKKNSSVGWGLFYWLVNFGAMMGPWFAAFMRSHGWRFVFFGSAGIILLNLPMLLTYGHVDSGADKTKKVGRVVVDTLANFFLNPRLMIVVVLFSGFWMLLYQLWDLMPNFYTDWVDSIPFVKSNAWLPQNWLDAKDLRGVELKQEIALNLNSILVVLFVVPMSFLVAKGRVLRTISIGVSIVTVGTFVYGTSPSLYVIALGIVMFSLGEMLTGPKKSEFFSLIAPPGKKALYLGYLNIPVAIGQGIGAKIAGWQYGTYGEKATLALRYLAEKRGVTPGGPWNGDVATLETVTGIARKDAFLALVRITGQDAQDATNMLWTEYRPYAVWYPFVAIGIASLAGILVFSHLSKRWKDMNV